MLDESATSGVAGHDEVWLRGNLRPAAALAGVAGVLGLLVVGVAGWLGGAAWAGRTAVIATLLIVPTGAAFIGLAARPRLRRRGAHVEVRLSPFGLQRVPLDVVECVFPGSRPLPPPVASGRGERPDRRVTTVIIRLAERATEWRERPTYGPWGTWEDGHIVIDGRWSEPLSPDRTRALAARLIAARNGRAGDCSGSPAA